MNISSSTLYLFISCLFLYFVSGSVFGNDQVYPDFFEKLGITISEPLDPSLNLERFNLHGNSSNQSSMLIQRFEPATPFAMAIFSVVNSTIRGATFTSPREAVIEEGLQSEIQGLLTMRHGTPQTVNRSLLVKGEIIDIQSLMWESPDEKVYFFTIPLVGEFRVVIFHSEFLSDDDFFLQSDD